LIISEVEISGQSPGQLATIIGHAKKEMVKKTIHKKMLRVNLHWENFLIINS